MTDSTSHYSGPEQQPRPIRVRSTSRVTLVAGAIAAVLRETGTAEVHAIGAGAVNQAVKAIATARAYLLASDQAELRCTPYFHETVIDDEERTGIRFVVEIVRLEP